MPLVDPLTGRRIYGRSEMICVCGHTPEWHKKLNRACGTCTCGGFKIAIKRRVVPKTL